MSFFKNKNVYILAFFIVLIVSLIYKVFFKGTLFDSIDNHITESTIESSVEVMETNPIETSQSSIYVYLCGEVNSPGVYEVSYGTILYDVINMAGGLKADAPVNYINMVYEINSNISIYIPSLTEINESSGVISGIDNEIIRLYGNDSSFEETYDPNLIDINSASKELLMTLPGIGEVTADAIINYRSTNRFNSIEDLKNVPGIGESKYSKVESFICVK